MMDNVDVKEKICAAEEISRHLNGGFTFNVELKKQIWKSVDSNTKNSIFDNVSCLVWISR